MSGRQPPPLTKPSTALLSEVARYIVKPEGIVSTGWPAVRETNALLGTTFDAWQDGAGKLILAKNGDGLYAADTVVISIARQVAKTFLVGSIVFALCIIFPGLTVIWTAHRFRTARETFTSMRGMAKRPSMLAHIDPKDITSGAGNEAIVFRNTSRVLFGARESGFGVGFTKVGVLVIDEAQRCTETTMDDLTPTMNQAPNPLLFMIGTPPRPKDPGEVFTQMRADALSGESLETLYIELSADPDFEPTAKPAPMTDEDWAQIGKANPSFPHRTTRRAILRMRKALTPESMKREGYGIWDDDSAGWQVVSSPVWASGRRPERVLAGLTPSLAIAATPDLSSAALVGAAVDGDEVWVKVLAHGAGVSWLVDEARRVQGVHRSPIVVDKGGPCKALIPQLRDAGLLLHEVTAGQKCDADGAFATAMNETRTVRHMGHPELDTAVRVATWRTIGEVRAFGRKAGDITPLEAAALAAAHARGSNYDVSDSLY